MLHERTFFAFSSVHVYSPYYISEIVAVLQRYRRPSHAAMQNSTLRNFIHLRPIITKLDVIDYVGNPHSDANFNWIWVGGELLATTKISERGVARLTFKRQQTSHL